MQIFHKTLGGITECFSLKVELQLQNVILGIIDCQSSSVAINHLLLIYSISDISTYVGWKQSRSLSGALKCFLQNTIRIEKKIAGKNNTLHVHYKKCNFLFDIL